MDEKLVADVQGACARLLLNRPGRLNALDAEMLLAIERWLSQWEQDPAISVLLLGSTTPRAFTVGADIEVLSRMNESTMRDWEMLGNRVLDRLQFSPLISVASIAGHALGGGLTLAAACDFRVCSATAGFGQPEIDLGWVPGWGGVARLARLVGMGRAKELCMTGRRIDSAAAQAMGLVNRVVPPDLLETETAALLAELTGKSREALIGIKALAEGVSAHRFDALLNSMLLNNDRGQAAIAAFLARKNSREQREG